MTDEEIERRLADALNGRIGSVPDLIEVVEFLLEERKSWAAALTGKKKRRAARPPAPAGEAWGTGLNPRERIKPAPARKRWDNPEADKWQAGWEPNEKD